MSTTALRGRQLARIIYLQAIFLGLTYVIGVWQTLTLQVATLTTPAVVGHGIVAAGFTLLTGLVGLVAAVQGMKRVAVLNFGLFIASVVGGATGFSFLGNPVDIPGMNLTNMAMISVVGLGMPVSGYSLASASKMFGEPDRGEDRTSMRVTFLALAAVALTVITGAGSMSTTVPAAMLMTHFAVSAVTAALVVGVVVAVVRRGLASGLSVSVTRRLDYSLLALCAVAVAVATGVLDYFSGGVPYSVGMSEMAALVYGFLVLAAGTGFPIPSAAPLGISAGLDESRRGFIRVTTAASLVLAVGGLAALLRSITLAPPPANQPVRTFPRYEVANLSALQVGQPVSFNYPLDNEPNILVKLGVKAEGGVGPAGDIVAFSQYCQHLGCVYAFQPAGTSPVCNPNYVAPGPVGYCCCHGTVYDFADGASVVGGPSPRPAPQVILEVDSSGAIYAVGMMPPAIFGHGTGSDDVTNDLQGGNLVA